MEGINKKIIEQYREDAIKRMEKFSTFELDFTIIARSLRPSMRVVGEGCVCKIIMNKVQYDKNKDIFTLKYETKNAPSVHILNEHDFSYSMCDFVFNDLLNYLNISMYKTK